MKVDINNNFCIEVLESLPIGVLVTSKVEFSKIANGKCIWYNSKLLSGLKISSSIINHTLKYAFNKSGLFNYKQNDDFIRAITPGNFTFKLSNTEVLNCKLVEMANYFIFYFIGLSKLDPKENKENLIEPFKQRILELEEKNKELSSYNYMVAHDLKTPINSIKLFVKLLGEELQQSSNVDSEAFTYFEIILKSLNQMNLLIENLLSYSMSDQQPLVLVKTDLADLFTEVFEELIAGETKRKVKFTVSGIPGVKVDKKLFRQVISNLLANALKYTKTKDITRIRVYSEFIHDELRVYVKDNGIGFNVKDSKKIFEVFEKSTHQRVKFDGHGIGLAIVKRIIEYHNGQVWAISQPLKGATICFTLPETLLLTQKKLVGKKSN